MICLEVKNLTKHFAGVSAVANCSFTVETGAINALIGPNGSGKTTIFDIITGFTQPNAGEIIFKGRPILGLKPYQIAQYGLGRTFQLIRLFPKLSVLDNLLLAKPQAGENFWTALFRPFYVKKEEQNNKTYALKFLDLVDLSAKKHSLAENLSYGQQKLLEIARLLATGADCLLLDEPMAGLHPKMRQKLARVLLQLKQRGKTILFIEHDTEAVAVLADKVIRLGET